MDGDPKSTEILDVEENEAFSEAFQSMVKNGLVSLATKSEPTVKPASSAISIEFLLPKAEPLEENLGEVSNSSSSGCSSGKYSKIQSGMSNQSSKNQPDREIFHCSECSSKFRSKPGWKLHLKKIHQIIPQPAVKTKPVADIVALKCDHCDYIAPRVSKLKNHLMIHSGEKPFACDLCDYRSRNNNHLLTHKRFKHTREKPFKCDSCDYRSSDKSTVTKHWKMLHSDAKPFKCISCPQQFRTNDDLFRHIRAKHSGDKPYKCDFCDFAARKNDDLMKHTRFRHTGEKPYQCNDCDYRSSDKSNVTKHWKKHHGGPKT